MLMTEAGADTSQHTRLRTPNGAVHVWKPAAYDPSTAGIVIYVHGYYVDVDDAWRAALQAPLRLRHGRILLP